MIALGLMRSMAFTKLSALVKHLENVFPVIELKMCDAGFRLHSRPASKVDSPLRLLPTKAFIAIYANRHADVGMSVDNI